MLGENRMVRKNDPHRLPTYKSSQAISTPTTTLMTEETTPRYTLLRMASWNVLSSNAAM